MKENFRNNIQFINDIFIDEIMDTMDEESFKFFTQYIKKDESLFHSIKMKSMYNEFIKSEIQFFLQKFKNEYRLFLNDMLKGNIDSIILTYSNQEQFEKISDQLTNNKHINNLTIIKENRDDFYYDINDSSLILLSESIKNLEDLFIINIEIRKNELTKNSIYKLIHSFNKFNNIRSFALDVGDLINFDDFLMNELCKFLLNLNPLSALSLSFYK